MAVEEIQLIDDEPGVGELSARFFPVLSVGTEPSSETALDTPELVGHSNESVGENFSDVDKQTSKIPSDVTSQQFGRLELET